MRYNKSMLKLSLCIATYNEEKFIHYPLESAYDLVDEVIIVDGGSEDKTVEIAKSYGPKVRVIQADNPAMFHINKQKALDAAKGDWILQLDADEAVSPKLKGEIRDAVTNCELRVMNAFWIPRKNWFLTGFLTKGGIYPDATIRLYKNGSAHFPCKSVHENVEVKPPVILTPTLRREKDPSQYIGTLKHDILHYADQTFERYISRWNRYTSLDAQELLKNKTRICAPCYFVGKPLGTFFSIYFRHKGFMDGFPGFVWALFSSIRWWVIYVKARSVKHQS